MISTTMINLTRLHLMLPMHSSTGTRDAFERLRELHKLRELTFIGRSASDEGGSVQSILRFLLGTIRSIHVRSEYREFPEEEPVRSKAFTDDFEAHLTEDDFAELMSLSLRSWTNGLQLEDLVRVLSTVRRMPSMSMLKVNAPADTGEYATVKALREARPEMEIVRVLC
jgi:hypothetical protein